jgi:hypothetical protein
MDVRFLLLIHANRSSRHPMRLPVAPLLLALWAAPLAAQTDSAAVLLPPGGPPPGDTVAALLGERASLRPPVAQTFDWWRERGIPTVTAWGQPVDTAGTRQILSWTTMPEYTSPLVNHLPEHPTVVSPTRHFGYPIGRPGHLHRTADVYGYMEALAASSPRVQIDWLGATEDGQRLMVVQVGSEQNLARLEDTRQAMHRLSDPRDTPEDEARRIIREAPIIYTFFAGLHSPETGPPEMVMELAYRLAVSEDPSLRAIRDSAVVFIVPVAEPTGRDRVVEWHRRHNADAFRWEDRRPGPPYWGKYIFHDINRDGMQLTARTTQEMVAHYNRWRYPVGHDLHESVPYLYVSTGTGPYNPTVDPIAISEWQWFSNFEVTALTALGMPGVWTHGFYDGWYPGYLLWVPNVRNGIGRFYETFGSSVPNTMVRRVEEARTRSEWYRPNPPRAETTWSLRNNTNYMQTGVLTVLQLAAANRSRILEQYWTKANNSVNRGRNEAPYAYVVPAEQPRRRDAAYMLNLLRRQGIELHRAEAAGRYGDVSVARGDYVIRMDQPWRNFVQMMMEVQRFPEGAPRPYDDVAWTWPLMFDVDVHAVADSAVRRLAMNPMQDSVSLPGRARRAGGSTAWYLVNPHASAHSIRARYALRDVPVHAARDSVRAAGVTWPPGTWLIEASRLAWDDATRWAAEHGFELVGVPAAAVRDVQRHETRLPRLAVLHTWTRTQDDGWVRYTLDYMGVPFTYVAEDRLAEGRLRDRFDVILFPTQGRMQTGRSIFQGVDPRFGPLPYTRTELTPSHGAQSSTEDMTGGMGYAGLAALQEFMERGGTLITLGSATTLPVELGLVREVTVADRGQLFVPGSIVRGRVARAAHPLTYGYRESFPVFHQFGPYLNVPTRQRGRTILTYAPAGDVFMSGYVSHPAQLAEQPALVTMPVGEGQAVLFGFNPLHRFQNHGNFALVWNALLHWNQLRVGLGEPTDEETPGG